MRWKLKRKISSRRARNFNDELRIIEDDIFTRVEKLIVGGVITKAPGDLKKGDVVDRAYLCSLERDQWFDVAMADESLEPEIGKIACTDQGAA